MKKKNLTDTLTVHKLGAFYAARFVDENNGRFKSSQ